MVIITAHCDAKGFTLDAKQAKEFLPTTHDLKKLAAQAKLRINAKDRTMLSKLSKYTVWAGRYPIPLFASGYDGPAFMERVGAARTELHAQQWKQYDALYRKLHRLAVRKVFKSQAIRG